MSVNVYNVIWADDECETLKKDKNIRKFFDKHNIEVLEWAHTSTELKVLIEKYRDKVDAVIVDGNFSKEEVEYLEPDDISGLMHTVSFIESFNARRDIPFYLYTAREVVLQQKCRDSELDYFESHNSLIQKGHLEELAQKIVIDVDNIHSAEFLVKKKYQYLIEMAECVSHECSTNLFDFLLNEARDKKFDKAIDMFTSLRKMLEQIVEQCKKYGFLPPEIASLNNAKYFWCIDIYTDKTENKRKIKRNGFIKYNKTFKPTEQASMPNSVAYSLKFLIDITQEGSHATNDLLLNVSEYVHNTANPFVFRSCLYQVMDIIRWYNELRKKQDDCILKGDLYNIEDRDNKHI